VVLCDHEPPPVVLRSFSMRLSNGRATRVGTGFGGKGRKSWRACGRTQRIAWMEFFDAMVLMDQEPVKRETCEKSATWTDWVPTSFGPSRSSRLSRSAILRIVLPLSKPCGSVKLWRATIVFPHTARAISIFVNPMTWARFYDSVGCSGQSMR